MAMSFIRDRSSHPRRLPHSPQFWFFLALGSILLHGLALWFLQPLLRLRIAETSSASFIPIEMLEEVTVEETPAPEPTPSPTQQKEPEPPPPDPTPVPVVPEVQPESEESIPSWEAFPEPFPPSPTLSPFPFPEPEPTPSPEPTPEPKPTPSPEPTPEPKPTPSPEPTPEPKPTPSPEPTPENSPVPTQSVVPRPVVTPSPDLESVPVRSPAPSPTPQPSASPLNPSPPDPPVAEEELPNIEDIKPEQFAPKLLGLQPPPPEQQTDIPDQWAKAKPLDTPLIFDSENPTCALESDTRQYFGQTITLFVTIDENGRILPSYTRVLNAQNTSIAYQNLVQCLVNQQTWTFEAAIAGNNPVVSNAQLEITLDPILPDPIPESGKFSD
ncbi:hypothetical protein PMG71_14385 [Roseofilum sp. BLCC_M154]|uniref:Uncharacterized protein n=1 Tax=Roseofilum acuticapitatum BLCC-M154 TaxID=3022444 RepID=A0ABT7AWH0_9CYAN|nr:hypothetical protein [Roseofilum acuticapitatum]MDJ1170616.1 hypothetical protein [Roseofilum acuticapitatum BLCC-M154]